jgi:SAM-dependent methyltransferase
VSLVYRLLYLVGFTPWDTDEVSAELSALIEGDEALPPGGALDIGCGTGTQAAYLARHGWRVTAIDVVERPLRHARERADAEGVHVNWIRADVTRLEDLGLSDDFTLLFDRGCFHGLDPSERSSYARGVTSLAPAGTTLLMLAFAPNRVRVGPAGVSEAEIAAEFSDWTVASV